MRKFVQPCSVRKCQELLELKGCVTELLGGVETRKASLEEMDTTKRSLYKEITGEDFPVAATAAGEGAGEGAAVHSAAAGSSRMISPRY